MLITKWIHDGIKLNNGIELGNKIILIVTISEMAYIFHKFS